MATNLVRASAGTGAISERFDPWPKLELTRLNVLNFLLFFIK